MRDPKRIKRICKLLEENWLKTPDQRLGQFIINYLFPRKPAPHIFYQEDDVTELKLKDIFNENKA